VQFCDIATRQVKRASEMKKNELIWEMMETCDNNTIKFCYVLMGSWFGSVENFCFIVRKKKHLIAAFKDNRLIALNEEDKQQGRFVRRIVTLELSDKQMVRGWLKGYVNEVHLVRPGLYNRGRKHGVVEPGVRK
jgi:hypothetical protein